MNPQCVRLLVRCKDLLDLVSPKASAFFLLNVHPEVSEGCFALGLQTGAGLARSKPDPAAMCQWCVCGCFLLGKRDGE